MLARVAFTQNAVFSHNTFEKVLPGATESFALRDVCTSSGTCPSGLYLGTGATPDLGLNDVATASTKNVVMSDNIFHENGTVAAMKMGEVTTGDSVRFTDIIFERNFCDFTSTTSKNCASFKGDKISVRNNIANTSGTDADMNVFGAEAATAGIPATTNIWFQNNTAFGTGASTTTQVINFPTGTTGSAVNNLAYLPNNSVGLVVNISGATVSPNSNNSLDAEMRSTNPGFDVYPPVALKDYRIGAGSYALGAGTKTGTFPAWADNFLHCQNVDGTANIGAMGKRTTDHCRGVSSH